MGEETLYADQVTTQNESPEIFKNIPKPKKCPDYYTDFISKRAVELSALLYTGHKVKKHSAPETMWLNDDGYFNYLSHMQGHLNPYVLINEKEYFVIAKEIGVNIEYKLMDVVPKDNDYVINALFVNYYDKYEELIRLELAPGDVAGTWKRKSFTIISHKNK